MANTKNKDLALLKEAVRLYEGGDKPQARFVLRVASEANPMNDLVWVWRAGVSRDRREALEYLSQALEVNGANTTARRWHQKFADAAAQSTSAGSSETPRPAPTPIRSDDRHIEELSRAGHGDVLRRLIGDAAEQPVAAYA